MAEFRYSIIKNPEIFMENRLPAHSDHAYYRSEESAWQDALISGNH